MKRFLIISVICLIAILLLGGYIFFKMGPSLAVSSTIRAENDLNVLSTQLHTYELYSLQFPTTEQGLKALVEKPTIPPIPRRWEQMMEKLPKDPWGNPYQYRLNTLNNPPTFELFSFGPDGNPNDDIYFKK
jgi:general secretion pathway protein G